MRSWLLLIAASLCMPCQCWPQGRSVSPPNAQPAPHFDVAPKFDRDAFTITRWDLNIIVDPQLGTLGCRGKIILRNDSDTPQAAVSLQISSTLSWSSIRASGNPIEFSSTKLASDIDHTGGTNEAVALLPQSIAPGAVAEIEIGYAGYIRQSATRLERVGTPLEVAERSDWDQISEDFTGVRGMGNVIWYPVSIAPSRLGDGNRLFDSLARWKARHAESSFHALYTLQADYRLLANYSHQVIDATEKSTGVLESNLIRLGTETPFFIAGKYKAIDTTKGQVFCFSSSAAVARKYADILSSLEPIVGGATTSLPQKVGAAPVPTKTATSISTKESPVAVIELPDGFVQFESGPALLLPLRDASKTQIQQLLIHTVTHGAFYSRRAWIYEGLAHYAQARMLEEQQGRKAAIDFIEQRRGALAIAESFNLGGSASPTTQSLINTSDEIFYRSKAMFVWWMVHDMIGDAALKKALAKYRPDEDREPSYIERLLEAASGRNLEWFLGDWVYRDRGLPDFRITSVYARENLNGGYMVTVSVENLGDAGAEVPISLRTRDGETRTRLELMGKDKASARIQVRDRPLEATVNDGSVPESDPNNNTYTVPSPP